MADEKKISSVAQWDGTKWDIYQISAQDDLNDNYINKKLTTDQSMNGNLTLERNQSTNNRKIIIRDTVKVNDEKVNKISIDIGAGTSPSEGYLTGFIHLGYGSDKDTDNPGTLMREDKTALLNTEDGFIIRTRTGNDKNSKGEIVIPYGTEGQILTNHYKTNNEATNHQLSFGTNKSIGAIHFQNADGVDTSALLEQTYIEDDVSKRRFVIRIYDETDTSTENRKSFVYHFPYRTVGEGTTSTVATNYDINQLKSEIKTDINTINTNISNCMILSEFQAANYIININKDLKFDNSGGAGTELQHKGNAAIAGFYTTSTSSSAGSGYLNYGLRLNGNTTDTNQTGAVVIACPNQTVSTANFVKNWHMSPRKSGTMNLGTPALLWNQIYNVSGAISTSDRNKKENINSLSDKYLTLFSKLNPVSYKFKKGSRTHVGFISQEVEEALHESNLTAIDFAGFCKDYNDETGDYDYSLRYNEFIALNTMVIQQQQKKIEDLEARLAALEK